MARGLLRVGAFIFQRGAATGARAVVALVLLDGPAFLRMERSTGKNGVPLLILVLLHMQEACQAQKPKHKARSVPAGRRVPYSEGGGPLFGSLLGSSALGSLNLSRAGQFFRPPKYIYYFSAEYTPYFSPLRRWYAASSRIPIVGSPALW